MGKSSLGAGLGALLSFCHGENKLLYLKNKEKSSHLNNLGKEKGKGLVEARYFC